jgi:hypothetical protein
MDGSQAYTLRKTARTLIWDSYRSQHGGQRQKFLLFDLLGNSEIKRQPIGNQGSEKKIQIVEKK